MFVGSAKALTKTMYHEYLKSDECTINGIAIYICVHTFNNNQTSNETIKKTYNKEQTLFRCTEVK